MNILLTGRARSGKGEAAKALKELGFMEMQFSAKVKEALYELNPLIGFTLKGTDGEWIRLKDYIDEKGWEAAKEIAEVRGLLQRMGTEVGRELYGEDFWVTQVKKELNNSDHEDFVLSDTRFDNEATIGDLVIEVVRDRENGLGTNSLHESEKGIDKSLIHVVLDNNGTIEELRQNVKDIINDYRSL